MIPSLRLVRGELGLLDVLPDGDDRAHVHVERAEFSELLDLAAIVEHLITKRRGYR